MTMKTIFTLFLFATGLGMSAAYAYPPVFTCENRCDYDYRYCLHANGSDGIPACQAQSRVCYDRCAHSSPL